MTKKMWRAKRELTVHISTGDVYEKEYTEDELELLLGRDIIEEVKPAPAARKAPVKKEAADGKN